MKVMDDKERKKPDNEMSRNPGSRRTRDEECRTRKIAKW